MTMKAAGTLTRQIAMRLQKLDARRIDRGIGTLLCILAAMAWLPRSKGPIDLRWDAGAYYLLGTSITQGQGYRLLNEPGNPNHTAYPPLMPLFATAHQLLLGTTDPLVVGRALRLSACLLFALQAFAIGRVHERDERVLDIRTAAPLHFADCGPASSTVVDLSSCQYVFFRCTLCGVAFWRRDNTVFHTAQASGRAQIFSTRGCMCIAGFFGADGGSIDVRGLGG